MIPRDDSSGAELGHASALGVIDVSLLAIQGYNAILPVIAARSVAGDGSMMKRRMLLARGRAGRDSSAAQRRGKVKYLVHFGHNSVRFCV